MTFQNFLFVVLVVLVGSAGVASARLGVTKSEWDEKFGAADAKGVYRWEGSGRTARSGPFRMMIRVEEGVVTGIQIRREEGVQISNAMCRELVGALGQSNEKGIRLVEALSEDGKTVTLLIKKDEPAPAPAVGAALGITAGRLMGKYTNDWATALGKPDGKGFYSNGPYRMQPATNKNNFKVDWIKVEKSSGKAFSDEEMSLLYESMTGKKREEVANPPGLHKEDTVLIMMKPKKK